MTFNVYNQAEFERAWTKVRPGDVIHVVYQNADHYRFNFAPPAPPQPGVSGIKGVGSATSNLTGESKAEWSGCCC